MGYRIEYRGNGKTPIRKRIGKPIPKWCVITGGLCLILGALWIGWQNDAIRSFLLPGDPEVTANALQELVKNLQEGETLGEAITAFCVEVMENAQILR